MGPMSSQRFLRRKAGWLELGSQNRKRHLGISFRMKPEGRRDKFAKMMLKPEGKEVGLT